MQARRNRETLLGKLDRRLEQSRPRQASVFLMGQLKRAQHARGAHRAATDLRLSESHRCAVCLQEQFLGCLGWRSFPAVIRAHIPPIPQHDECTAADAGRLRLDQRQHGLHRNGRVNR